VAREVHTTRTVAPATGTTVAAMAVRVQVVIDCHDPDALAHFWADLLGYELEPPPPGYDSWEAWLTDHGIPEAEWNSASAIVDPEGVGPRIFLQRVPEPKATKNRLHLDVWVEDIPRATDAVEALGATRVGPLVTDSGEPYQVLLDPAGNEFCLVHLPGSTGP